MNPNDAVDRIAVGGTYGLIAGLVFAIIAIVLGFQSRWIVQGWLYKERVAESKEWQELTESQGDKIERLTTLAETLQRELLKVSERSDRTATVAEGNSAKLDKLMTLFETLRRPTR